MKRVLADSNISDDHYEDANEADTPSESGAVFPRGQAVVDTDVGIEMSETKRLQQGRDCKLESLPPEIRREILSVSELADLKSLVQASPILHQQYLSDKRHILGKSLEQTLQTACLDAHVIYVCEHQQWDVAKALLLYPARTETQPPFGIENVPEDEFVTMVKFYFKFVRPLVYYYANWALRNLATEVNREHHCKTAQITSTEKLRLTRAVYRYHLASYIRYPTYTATSADYENMCSFLGWFEGWEIEEFYSFYQFAECTMDAVLSSITSDVHPDNPRFDNPPRQPTPPGAYQVEGFAEFWREGPSMNGELDLLYELLFTAVPHEDQVHNMQMQVQHSTNLMNPSTGVMNDQHQAERRRDYPSERDRLTKTRAPLPFTGDGNGPPLAWTTIWGDTYSNLYGFYASDDMREWGYVFWDAATLRSSGGLELLQKQWEERWEGWDPRDSLP